MLLGYAHIKTAAGKAGGEQIKAGAIGHRGSDGNDFVIGFGFADQRLRKDFGIAGGVRGGLGLHARQHIKLAGGVAAITGGFGRGVTFALFGQHMDQDRSGGPGMGSAQNRQQLIQIVAINRADVGKAQLFEQGAANRDAFQNLFCPARAFLKRLGQQGHHAFGRRFQIMERRARVDAAKIGRHRAHGRGNGHFVIVQNDEHAAFQMARVVQRLIGHTRTHRAIANDGHGIPRIAAQFRCHGKTQCCTDGGGRMGRAKGIKRAFAAFGKAGKPAFGAQGADPVAPPCQDFMRIALVADIPDDLVTRGVEGGVDGDGQFDHAKACAQMAAGDGNGGNRFSTQFIGQLAQFAVRQAFEVGRQGDTIKQRGYRAVGHGLSCFNCREK